MAMLREGDRVLVVGGRDRAAQFKGRVGTVAWANAAAVARLRWCRVVLHPTPNSPQRAFFFRTDELTPERGA